MKHRRCSAWLVTRAHIDLLRVASATCLRSTA
ncbi:putative leader peptide [Frankia sp. Cppng1_Ct_nod]